MHVQIDKLCEQQWLYPGKKSRHMLHLLYHQESLRTMCLQQDSDHVCLWPGYQLNYDTAKHSYSVVMKESTGEWNGIVLSSVMRVGSVCMWMMNVHVYGIDLVSVTFQSAFAHDTQASPQVSWCGGGVISYNSRSHLVFLQGKVNSVRYIAQVVNSVLLPFLW